MNTLKAKINDKEIELQASAALPFFYRSMFGDDILQDYLIVANRISELDSEKKTFAYEDLYTPEVVGVLEQMTYCMAKTADDSLPNSMLEWMETLSFLDLYSLFPTVLRLWNITNETKSTVKKKRGRSTDKTQ